MKRDAGGALCDQRHCVPPGQKHRSTVLCGDGLTGGDPRRLVRLLPLYTFHLTTQPLTSPALYDFNLNTVRLCFDRGV